MARIQRVVQYRYLNREKADIGDETLEGAIRDALKTPRDGSTVGTLARFRMADLDQSGQITLWNGLKGLADGEVLCGELVLYKQGFDVTAIEERLDKDSARFDLITFKTDGKSKPVEGALYFAVKKDHVGIIQSNAVTGKWLERYLTWLLKDVASLLEPDAVINLNAQTSIGEQTVARQGGAKSLIVHAKPDEGGKSKRSLREKVGSAGASVLEVLKMLGVGDDAIQSIENDIPKDGKLEGDFLVYIKEGRKRRPISTTTLDHAMRNIEPGDIEIETKGSRIKHNMLTLSEPVRVTQTPTGLEPNEAMEVIVNVLYQWAERGNIDFGTD